MTSVLVTPGGPQRFLLTTNKRLQLTSINGNLATGGNRRNENFILPKFRNQGIKLLPCKQQQFHSVVESGFSNSVLLLQPGIMNIHAGFKYCKSSVSARQHIKGKLKTFSSGENQIVFPRRVFSTKILMSSSTAEFELSSPTYAGHHSPPRGDDISALSHGFEKICLNRRRLSTVSDLTTLFEKNRESASASSETEDGKSQNVTSKNQRHWLDNQTRISESSEGDAEEETGHVNKNVTQKTKQDIFLLLQKVIEFKGRNVSHITVEQSVKELCTVYNETDDAEKHRFFIELAEKYGVDQKLVSTLATSLLSAEEENVRFNIQEKLRAALVAKYQWLFSQIGRLENGVKFLVDFRTDLLDALEMPLEGSSHVRALNICIRDLLGMWFGVGFLNLERVTWKSSCDMLQKISEYEAVHPMRNWTDLKRRVGPYRRCFVFTHASMPTEPVVVLHTALTDHIPKSIREIVSHKRMMSLDSDAELTATHQKEDPSLIDTAVFYSITSTQRGLMGIEFGNYIIKRVVRELQSEFQKMNQFSSLSPIPGFTNWLKSELKTAMKNHLDQKLFTQHEIESIAPALQASATDTDDFLRKFQRSLELNDWYSNEKLRDVYENPLMRLCGQYLYLVKRRGYAMDAVANFHLKNGAVIWRLNWLGDNSPKGLGQSCGMMVNYRYFLEACETNSQNYMEKQTIEISDQVRLLVKLTQMDMASKI